MLIGKRLNGRYRIEKLIGGGGMSNVYLAYDIILDRDVAVKILKHDFSNEEELHRRFQREALSATSLAHPNIVNIFDVGEEADLQFLVMEYVTGKTLKEYIVEHAPVAPEKTVKIMGQLTAALAHAHQNQIVHRDIKPQNILMDEQGNVKIADFGIAMALSATSYTQTNSVLGTVHYLSPEQARGGTATKRSDIYSLGIVMFELLTGRLPFSGESAVAIALKHLQAETPSIRALLPEVPQSLENIVLKATAKDPLHRYQSAEEMGEDLAVSLTEERINEPKFIVPIDDDATKAMPAIKNGTAYGANLEETKATVKPAPPVQEPVKKKKKKWPWVIGIPSLLLIAGLLTALMFPGLFEPPKIEVPDVSNMEEEAAAEELLSSGFVIGDEREQPSEEVEEGHVIRTIPEAGKMRDRETEIQLIVSSGKQQVEFLDYTGRNIEQVVEVLTPLDYLSIDQQELFSEEPAGTILEQNIEPGTEVIPSETEVVFTVSKGKDMRTVSDLAGFTEEDLNEYARSSGFDIRITGEEFSASVPAGTVLRQSPSPEQQLEVGSTIEVIMSKGPEAAPVKTYIQSIQIPYEPPAEDETEGEEEEPEEPVEQTVQIFIQDRDRTLDEPAEEFTITADETRRIELQIEEGQTAIYRVVRDSSIILEETIPYDHAE